MAKPTWEPKTAVEKTTIQKYRGKPRLWRMEEAVRLHLEDGVSQSEAARMCGVSRSKVNVRVVEAKKMLAAQAERAQASLDEKRILGTTVPDVSDELGIDGADSKSQPYITTERRVPTFREFNELYFSGEICPDCGIHHDTPEFHGQIMDLLEDRSKRMKLINCAPYSAKSTTATLKSTLYELVRDPSSRTAIISQASDLAKAFLYQIKQHLQDPDLYNGAARNLIEDWGPFYNPNSWAADQIYIYGRSGAQKDPSVSTYGFGTQIYGRRFDRMIFDDVATLDNQNTSDAVSKMYRKIWQEYVNRVGKALALDTEIPTPDGWSTIADIQIGDTVFDMHGDPTEVVRKSPVFYGHECFDVAFSDGTVVRADADHRWWVEDSRHGGGPGHFKTTAELLSAGLTNKKTTFEARWRVPDAEPLELPDVDLPVDPYVLGAWLGDGAAAGGQIACHISDQPEMRAAFELCGVPTTAQKNPETFGTLGLKVQLRAAGVLDNKHIPAAYLRASFKQRLSLLQGLMDTDGSCDKRHRCAFYNTNPHLVDGVFELAASLGYRPTKKLRPREADGFLDIWVVAWTPRPDRNPFRLTRKAERVRPATGRKACRYRYIRSIAPVASEPMQCIGVASPTQTFLATRAMVPTANTGQLIFVGTRVAAGDIYSMLDDVEGMNVLRFPCIIDEDTEQMLWGEHFPFKAAVAQRAAMSLEQFQLVYQNVETMGANASFSPEMIAAAKERGKERAIGQYDPAWALVAGLDPAGANDQAGFTSMVLLGLDTKTGMRHLVDLVNIKQMKAPDILGQIYAWAEQYPLRELRVEVNGLQALALDEKIPTPSGWTTMADVAVGDEVFAPDGSPTKVVAKSDIHLSRDCYRVNFNDGTSVVTDGGHRWHVGWHSNGYNSAGWTTTADLRTHLDQHPTGKRWVEVADPLELPEADLPIDPYVLGIWLGDGSSQSGQIASDPNNGDQAVLRASLELAGYELKTTYVDPYSTGVLGLRPQLKELGVLGDKHIPRPYLRASLKQRQALLQGLMDSDGSINEIGHAHFANKNQRLIAETAELISSLGWRPRINHATDISKVFFSPKKGDLEPFRLQRKLARVRDHNGSSRSTTRRLVVSVEPTGSVPVACIRVAHESSQFLCSERMVPTGNSQLYQYNRELNERLVNRGVRLVPHITHGRNKWDPNFGVESMASMFHNGLITMPGLDLNSRAKVRFLEDQLLGFPMKKPDDLVMAMWFASLGVREMAQRTALPSFDPRRKVPGRIARNRRVVNFGDKEMRQPTHFELTGQLEPSPQELTKLTNMDSSVLLRG